MPIIPPDFDALVSPLLKTPSGEEKDTLFRKKIQRLSNCGIGRRLSAAGKTRADDLPLTTYSFYRPFFENPQPSDLSEPIENYVKAMTSGSQGRPKWYLQPLQLFVDSARTLAAIFVLSTYDGERATAKPGDTVFGMAGSKPFAGGFLMEQFHRHFSRFFDLLPKDQGLEPPAQVMQLIQASGKVSIAFLPLPILMNMVLPRVGGLKLKGYLTIDMSARFMIDQIKNAVGARPTSAYASTETGMVSIPSLEHICGFTLNENSAFFEFIPEENAVSTTDERVEGVEALRIEQVRKGGRYQLVVTPFTGELTRFLTSDIMECLAEGDSILGSSRPVFRFASRVGVDIALHNFTRISEDELITALKTAGIRYAEFTARPEYSGPMEYLALYLETVESMPREQIEDLVHQKLTEIDRDYAMLSRMFSYKPLRVRLLSKGAFSRYLEGRSGQIKPERLMMKQENFDRLLRLSEPAGS